MILQVFETKPPLWNGAVRYVQLINKYFSNKDISLINYSTKNLKGANAKPLIYVSDFPIISSGFFRIRKEIKTSKYIFAHDMGSLTFYAAFWSRLYNKQLIYWKHVNTKELMLNYIGKWYFANILLWFIMKYERFIVNSSEYIILCGQNDEFNNSNSKTINIRLSVDFDVFKPISPIQKKERKEFIGISSDSIVISYFGRLSIDKNVESFYKIAERLLIQFNNIYIYCIGNGKIRPFQSLINNNHFSWKQSTNNIEYYMQITDITINVSHTDTGPLVIAESMACGAIPISTPVGFIPKLIEKSKTGYIVKQENLIENILVTVSNLIGQKERIERQSKNSILKIQNEFNPFEQELEKVFLKLSH